jgi:hypothetical protein
MATLACGVTLDSSGLTDRGLRTAGAMKPKDPHRARTAQRGRPGHFLNGLMAQMWRRFRLAPRTTRETYKRRSGNKNLPDGFFAWWPR